ncbi:MAG: hypothetical protein ACEPOW_09965, partial [Bacteroidales bacterium]
MAIICSPEEQFGSGAAYIYELKNQKWERIAKLNPKDKTGKGRFGMAVDFNESQAIISNLYGEVHIFEKPKSGWKDLCETEIVNVKTLTHSKEPNFRYQDLKLFKNHFIFIDKSNKNKIYSISKNSGKWKSELIIFYKEPNFSKTDEPYYNIEDHKITISILDYGYNHGNYKYLYQKKIYFYEKIEQETKKYDLKAELEIPSLFKNKTSDIFNFSEDNNNIYINCGSKDSILFFNKKDAIISKQIQENYIVLKNSDNSRIKKIIAQNDFLYIIKSDHKIHVFKKKNDKWIVNNTKPIIDLSKFINTEEGLYFYCNITNQHIILSQLLFGCINPIQSALINFNCLENKNYDWSQIEKNNFPKEQQEKILFNENFGACIASYQNIIAVADKGYDNNENTNIRINIFKENDSGSLDKLTTLPLNG